LLAGVFGGEVGAAGTGNRLCQSGDGPRPGCDQGEPDMSKRAQGRGGLLCLPVETPWGWLAPVSRGAGVVRCCLPVESRELAIERVCRGDEVAVVGGGDCGDLDLAAKRLAGYFLGEAVGFDVPLDLGEVGAFSALVLAECNRIGYGDTYSYGELALRVGRPGGARAVGQVMRRNPLAPLVPCHRVLGAGGALTGFGGGLEMKRRLLELEAAARMQQSG